MFNVPRDGGPILISRNVKNTPRTAWSTCTVSVAHMNHVRIAIDGRATPPYFSLHTDMPCTAYTHGSCTKYPPLKIEARKKAAYCKLHTEDGMINVRHKRCSHGTCPQWPSLGIGGNDSAV